MKTAPTSHFLRCLLRAAARRAPVAGLVLPALLLASGVSARANVYATNVRLNGGTTNLTLPWGGGATIQYLLNEPATAGVTVDILSGAGVVRTIALPGGGAGTSQGTNAVVWDGQAGGGTNVPTGSYTVRVTAAANGYGSWTQISDDLNTGNYVYEPRGLAVNRNTNSPAYGRVFVSNATLGPSPGFNPGDRLGLQMLNADGSPSAENYFSDGGWTWAGDGVSPWKVEVSADDQVHVSDWASNGVVLSFDQALSAASRTVALREDNWPNGGAVRLSGPFVSGAGAEAQLWMADTNLAGVGVRRWPLPAAGGVATNDLGATTVQAGSGSQLDRAPFDVALDVSNRIYVIQNVTAAGSASYRVFRFPAFADFALTNADWRVGSANNNQRGAHGVAVDAGARYVAVAFRGVGEGAARTGGAVKLFNASNGVEVVSIAPSPQTDPTDVAWDNVGNLYVCDNWDLVWRVYSPPGTNQATTYAVPGLTVAVAPVPPTLSAPSYSGGQFSFTLTGQPGGRYGILTSTNVAAPPAEWTCLTTNTEPNAVRALTLPAPQDRGFYRALLLP